MKKLIIALVVTATAVAVQAASFNWKTGTSQQVYAMNTSDRAGTLTAYLFDIDAYGQADVLSAFNNGTFNSLTKLSSVETASTGAIQTSATGNAFTWGDAGDTLTAYFAILLTKEGKDYLYISPTADGTGLVSGTTTLSFSAKTSSQLAALDAAAGYQGAGWYGAVPEPTSGLLLLLGMAGLALKRKRA